MMKVSLHWIKSCDRENDTPSIASFKKGQFNEKIQAMNENLTNNISTTCNY